MILPEEKCLLMQNRFDLGNLGLQMYQVFSILSARDGVVSLFECSVRKEQRPVRILCSSTMDSLAVLSLQNIAEQADWSVVDTPTISYGQ